MRGRANLPTRRWRSPYTEGLGFLRGGFGFPTWSERGAVGVGGFVVGDGAAGGDMICRRTGRGTPVVVVSRQDGGSPYGRALVLAAGLEPAVWCPSLKVTCSRLCAKPVWKWFLLPVPPGSNRY